MEYTTKPDEAVEDRVLAMLDAEESEQDQPEEEQEPVEAEAQAEDAGEESEDQPAQTDDDYVEVEYEGKQYKLPPELKDAVLRQSDYTRKTQEVAELRKQAEQEREYLNLQAQMQTQFSQGYAQLTALDNQLAQYEKINWSELIDSDPVQAMKLDRQYRELQQYRNNTHNHLQSAQAQFQQQSQEHLAQQLAQGAARLQAEIPGWGTELAAQIRKTGMDYGFSEYELERVYDPRYVKVLHDAMKYRALQANKPEVAKKVQGKSPVLKPGNTQPNANKRHEMAENRKAIKQTSGRRQEEAATRAMMDML